MSNTCDVYTEVLLWQAARSWSSAHAPQNQSHHADQCHSLVVAPSQHLPWMSALAEHQADYVTGVQAACPACVLMFSLSRSVDCVFGSRCMRIGHLAAAHCFHLKAQRYSLAWRRRPTSQNGRMIDTGRWRQISAKDSGIWSRGFCALISTVLLNLFD